MFQKRLDGSVKFFLYWSKYKHGFGDLSGEYWLGNDKIHRLTSDGNKMLRVDLEDFKGNTSYAEYDMFGVMSESDKYKLILGSYSGDSIDMQFGFLLFSLLSSVTFPISNSLTKLYPSSCSFNIPSKKNAAQNNS